MESTIFELATERETQRLGTLLAKTYKNNPALILLSGDLGAGKTTLAQAFINCLLPSDQLVASPSYSYCNTYDANPRIHHFDLYRIENTNTIEELGLLEQLYDNTALRLVEWPERMPELIQSAQAHIFLEHAPCRRARVVNFTNTSHIA